MRFFSRFFQNLRFKQKLYTGLDWNNKQNDITKCDTVLQISSVSEKPISFENRMSWIYRRRSFHADSL